MRLTPWLKKGGDQHTRIHTCRDMRTMTQWPLKLTSYNYICKICITHCAKVRSLMYNPSAFFLPHVAVNKHSKSTILFTLENKTLAGLKDETVPYHNINLIAAVRA